jgi:hypothetical protein
VIVMEIDPELAAFSNTEEMKGANSRVTLKKEKDNQEIKIIGDHNVAQTVDINMISAEIENLKLFNPEDRDKEELEHFHQEITKRHSFKDFRGIKEETDSDTESISSSLSSSSNTTDDTFSPFNHEESRKDLCIKRLEKKLKRNKTKDNRKLIKYAKTNISGTVDNSQHNPARRETKNKYFDASILSNYIPFGNTSEEKCGYMDLLLQLYPGYTFSENRSYHGKERIIAHFDTHENMLNSCTLFNKKYPHAKIEPMKYYRLGKDRVSTLEFKILDISKDIQNYYIEKAIRNKFPRAVFHIRKRSQPNTVYFTISNIEVANEIKQTWQLRILEDIYEIAPAYFTKELLNRRRTFAGKFRGFNPNEKTVEILEQMEMLFNAKNVRRNQHDEEEVIIDFANERDLNFVLSRNINFGKRRIKGIREYENWDLIEQKDQILENKNSNQKKLNANAGKNTNEKFKKLSNTNIVSLEEQAERELKEIHNRRNRNHPNNSNIKVWNNQSTKGRARVTNRKDVTGANSIRIGRDHKSFSKEKTAGPFKSENKGKGTLRMGGEITTLTQENDISEVIVTKKPTSVGSLC